MSGGEDTPLARAQAALAAKRAAGVAVERVDPIEKARRKPTSLRLAVTAMCVRCLGGGDGYVPRLAIRECTAPSCPLYPVRPYQADRASARNAGEVRDA